MLSIRYNLVQSLRTKFSGLSIMKQTRVFMVGYEPKHSKDCLNLTKKEVRIILNTRCQVEILGGREYMKIHVGYRLTWHTIVNRYIIAIKRDIIVLLGSSATTQHNIKLNTFRRCHCYRASFTWVIF